MKHIHMLVYLCSLFSISTLGASPQSSILVNTRDVFEDLTGKKESYFLTDGSDSEREDRLRSLFVLQPDGSYALRTSTTGALVPAGTWHSRSLRSLRDSTGDMAKSGGTFSLIMARQPSKDSAVKAVVAQESIQSQPGNSGAVFQIVSTTTTLPLIGTSDDIMDIATTATEIPRQDTAAFISTLSAGVARWLFYNHTKSDKATQWPQTPSLQYNLYGNTNLPVTNGFIDFSKQAPQAVTFHASDTDILIHERVPVLYGTRKGAASVKLTEPFLIHQIFVSGIDLGNAYGTENRTLLQNTPARDALHAIIKELLMASYEATIRGAYSLLLQNQSTTPRQPASRILYLAPIGVGMYEYPFSLITEVIADMKDLIQASGLDIRLVIYNADSVGSSDMLCAPRTSYIQQAWNSLAHLVEATKGSITLADPIQGVRTRTGDEARKELLQFVQT